MIKSLKEIQIDILLPGLTADHATQLETLLKKTCNEYHYLFNGEFYQKEDGSN